MRRVLQIIIGLFWVGCALAEPVWVPPPEEGSAQTIDARLIEAIQRPQMFRVTTADVKSERAAKGELLLKFVVFNISVSPEWFADLERVFGMNAAPIVYRQATTADRVAQWVFGLVPFYAVGKQYAQAVGNKLKETEPAQPDLCFQGSDEQELRCYVAPDASTLLPLFNRAYLVVRLTSNDAVIEEFALPGYRVPLLNAVSVEQPYMADGQPSLNQFALVRPGGAGRQAVVNLRRRELPDGLVLDAVLAFDSGKYFIR